MSLETLHIAFDRHKYRLPLLVDAGEIGAIPGFIKTPRPHRLGFYEIALITEGRGALSLDGLHVEVAPHRLCITTPGEIRSWQLQTRSLGGRLAFFEAQVFDEFLADPRFLESLPVLGAAPPGRSIALDRHRFDELAAIVDAMQRELASVQADSGDVLRAETYRLLVALQRHAGTPAAAGAADRSRVLCGRFRALVETRFACGDRVGDYADRLGVSAKHLNDCVRASCGATASATIHARLQLEARRLLLHTELPVAEIADRLGFSDASYFVRFFKRLAGTTPRAFRARRGSPISPPLRALSPPER
jgi:AraC-like DNA-binding protein